MALTSFKVGTLECMDATKYAPLNETISLLSAATPYSEIAVEIAGRYPAYQRRQMLARQAPVTISLLRARAQDRRIDFDRLVAAFQPSADTGLVAVRWVEDGVIRKLYGVATEIVPSQWYNRATAAVYFPNPVPYVSYPGQAALLAGLTAHYRLGEPSGSTMEDRLNSYPGTYTASPTLGATGGLAGDTDTAVTFNGTSQYGRSTSTFANGVTEMSIGCWFKTTSGTAARQTLVSHSANGNPYNAQITKESGSPTKLTLRVLNAPTSNAAITSCTSVKTVNDGAWHHAVGVIKKGVGGILYVDGAEDASSAHALSTWAPGAGYGYVGAWYSGAAVAEFFPGTLDEVTFWSRALSADEVAYLYAAGITTL